MWAALLKRKKGVKSPQGLAALGLITKHCIHKDTQVFKEMPQKYFQITQLTNLSILGQIGIYYY